ncbi:M15 family metallopeptidase [Agromyces sp. Root81]|uniref:M15 family metallopeptidase n=1 Tax=Agromyces sp. Root81 TaxID=1736601 RepID=UPI0012F88AAD|nr:M15 family metallopeptidase [Agromyces sp. Root81]
MSSSERQDPSDEAGQKRRLVIAASLSLALVAVAVVVIGAVSGGAAAGSTADGASGSATSATPRPAPAAAPPPAGVDTFDRAAHSLDEPNSIWVVVNKLRPMNPQDFEPDDLVEVDVPHTWDPMLRQEAADAVVAMFQAASDEADLTLASNSAFRSYESQEEIYDGDDLLTARPGFSEHQTGLVMDIGADSGDCSLDACFADTPEGIWLRDNAWRFGFILRYPADKTDVTGYEFEPWHYRYVGVPLATEMHENGITTLEEFFGLPAAPEYE